VISVFFYNILDALGHETQVKICVNSTKSIIINRKLKNPVKTKSTSLIYRYRPDRKVILKNGEQTLNVVLVLNQCTFLFLTSSSIT